MHIDFHVHAAASSRAGFDPDEFQNTLHQAQKRKLDVLVLTDHLHLDNWSVILDWLDSTYNYQKPYYLAGDIKLVPGLEVSLAEGPHVVIAGSRGHVRCLYTDLKGHRDIDNKPALKTLLHASQDLHLITTLAHPYKAGAELTRLHKSHLNRFDALELNGNSLKHNPDTLEKLVYKIAAKHKISVITGSDSHGADGRLGSVATVLPRSFQSISDLRTMILAQRHKIQLAH